MSPRVTLPGADELFRATAPAAAAGDDRSSPPPTEQADAGAASDQSGRSSRRGRGPGQRGSTGATSGRERHDEKITVYVSAAELVDLEQARLSLRAEHGIAVDRGRIVREALAVVLADLDAKQADSILVRRLGAR